jgi:alpha-mannosidase
VYLRAAETGAAVLALGSDDGLAAWLNGALVFSLDAGRACRRDEDLVPVTLLEGWNRLLVKVTQYQGGWQFAARVLRPDGSVLPGLAFATTRTLGRGERFPDAAAAGLHIGVTVPDAHDRGDAASPATARLAASLHNVSAGPCPGVCVRVEESDGAAVVEAPATDLPPGGRRRVVLSCPAAAWARARLAPLTVRAWRGDAPCSPPIEVRPGLVETLRILAPGAAASLAGADRARLEQLVLDAAAGQDVVASRPSARRALARLADALARDDGPAGLTAAVRAADEAVLAARAARAGQVVHLVSHAHIDMNWLWQWPETVHICRDSFGQALRFIDEFPDFSFNQSQASCYEAMERYEPELFERIRRAVAAGRWTLTGGMWTEGDTNLSSGEALARSFLLAQRYFREKFGVRAACGWLPDNFGHTAQLPQLFRLAGIDCFYHMRCAPWDGAQLYWWEGLDGSRVLAKTGTVYGAPVTADICDEPRSLPRAVPQQMVVYGVGDHGGGPTRRDIETGLRLSRSRLGPAVRFSTLREYFDAVRPKAAALRVHRGELNFTFDGCYTSVARIKESNRALENALQAAEATAFAAAAAAGRPWPAEDLMGPWKTLVFNQFHDILPGSAIHESNRDSVARYAVAREAADDVAAAALRAIAVRVAWADPARVPVVVFNPLAWERDDVVEAELVVTDPFSGVVVRDAEGRAVPAQIVRTKQFDADIHAWVRFVARDVPPVGYRVFSAEFLREGRPVPVLHWSSPYGRLNLPAVKNADRTGLRCEGTTVSNRFFELRFDARTGALRSLRIKRGERLGAEWVGPRGANRLGLYVEHPRRADGWKLDPSPRGPLAPDVVAPAAVVEDGAESVTWMTAFAWRSSAFRLLTTVHADSPRIDVRLEADWLERGSSVDGHPMLRALIELAAAPRRMFCDVPFGIVARAPGREVPAQRWVDLPARGGGLAVLNDSKYGHSLHGATLRLGLLRAFVHPDELPDVGRHVVRWALRPHVGTWLAAGIPREGFGFNVPLCAVQARVQEGDPAPSRSFLRVGGDPWFVVTGIKRAEDGDGWIVRGYDASGRGADVAIEADRPIERAAGVDLLEEPCGRHAVRCEGGRVTARVGPWGILSVRWA